MRSSWSLTCSSAVTVRFPGWARIRPEPPRTGRRKAAEAGWWPLAGAAVKARAVKAIKSEVDPKLVAKVVGVFAENKNEFIKSEIIATELKSTTADVKQAIDWLRDGDRGLVSENKGHGRAKAFKMTSEQVKAFNSL